MRSGLDGRAASSTDQGGCTAGLALLAFAAIAVQPVPQCADAAPKRSAADTAEVSLALRMALSVEGVECQPK
jgi:hypothetical protein